MVTLRTATGGSGAWSASETLLRQQRCFGLIDAIHHDQRIGKKWLPKIPAWIRIPKIPAWVRIAAVLVAVAVVLESLFAIWWWWGRAANLDLSLVTVLIIVPLVLLPWGVWFLWWQLPKLLVSSLALKIRDPKARADVEDNFRKTIFQAITGVGAAIAALFAYLQYFQQQQVAHEQQQVAQKQFNLWNSNERRTTS
jgi:hypothetical protein